MLLSDEIRCLKADLDQQKARLAELEAFVPAEPDGASVEEIMQAIQANKRRQEEVDQEIFAIKKLLPIAEGQLRQKQAEYAEIEKRVKPAQARMCSAAEEANEALEKASAAIKKVQALGNELANLGYYKIATSTPVSGANKAELPWLHVNTHASTVTIVRESMRSVYESGKV